MLPGVSPFDSFGALAHAKSRQPQHRAPPPTRMTALARPARDRRDRRAARPTTDGRKKARRARRADPEGNAGERGEGGARKTRGGKREHATRKEQRPFPPRGFPNCPDREGPFPYLFYGNWNYDHRRGAESRGGRDAERATDEARTRRPTPPREGPRKTLEMGDRLDLASTLGSLESSAIMRRLEMVLRDADWDLMGLVALAAGGVIVALQLLRDWARKGSSGRGK